MSKLHKENPPPKPVVKQRNRYDQDETLETKFSFTHLKKSFFYIKKHTRSLVLSLLFNILDLSAMLSIPFVVKYALDNTVPNKDYRELLLLAGFTVLIVIFHIVLSTARSKMIAIASNEMVYDIRTDLFVHMQKLPFTYYDDRPHGKILVRVVNYVNNVSNTLSNGLIDFILQIVSIVITIVFMLLISPTLTIVVVAGLPILFVVMFLIRIPLRKSWQKSSDKNSNVNAYLQESLNGMMVTQSFGREKINLEIFESLATQHKKARLKGSLLSNLVWFTVDNIGQIVVSLLYIVGALWISPTADFSVMLAMTTFSWQFWQPISRISQIYTEFINTIAYLERIFEMMEEPVHIEDKPEAYVLPPIVGEVKFDDVTFAYTSHANVLENVSFTVPPGTSVALVGPTGAGKTTIVNLISRFYNITSGALSIDGHNTQEVTLHSLRGQMGIMLQDSFIFSGTVYDNVRYGKLDATDQEIREACSAVHADGFILELPKGYETELGEGGGGLSEGQKQLLSFARTIISNPRILILDEATSAVDTKTEQFVQETTTRLLKGRTSFIIAHRLSTIRQCDIILYIKDKNISEAGSHEELLKLKGDYYALYMSQLENI